MNQNISERDYWYNYFDIDVLLKNECKGQYIVCDSSSEDPNHFNRTLNYVCEQLRNDIGNINCAVIPINIGFRNYAVYEGSHWVGLVIRIKSDATFKALYADSYGNKLKDIFLTLLKTNGIFDIEDRSLKQQENVYDCGPWVVFNLDALARTKQLPKFVSEDEIVKQRLILKKLINETNEEKYIINIPDNVQQGKCRENTFIEENNKNNDLERLRNMIRAIMRLEEKKCDIRTALIEIGEEARNISYNDKHDPDSYYIRNRYGFIQRNKNKQENKNGIYFEKLCQLKICLEESEILTSIPNEEFESLRIDLHCLNQKISYIFIEENCFDKIQISTNHISADFTASISGLVEFSCRHYDQLILRQIRLELEEQEEINFSDLDNRYYFSRVFAIIGELLNEFLESKNSNIKNEIVSKAFKDLVSLRNRIVHLHSKIRSGIENKTEFINEAIVKIRGHLLEIISKHSNNDKSLEIRYSYEKCQEFKEETEKLLKYFFEKERTEKNEIVEPTGGKCEKEKPPKTNETIKSILDRLLSKACDIIEETVCGKGKSVESQLYPLNKQYQLNLSKLDDANKIGYPFALDLANKEIIVRENKRIPVNGFSGEVETLEKKKQPMDVSGKNTKIDSIFKAVNVEVNYLLSFFHLKTLDRRHAYIFQHIMLVIGQLMREIEDLNICEESNASWFFEKISKSLLLYEGKVSSKLSRNQGLAHNLWSFNEENFFKTLIDVLSAFEQFQTFSTIMEKDKGEISITVLHNIGVSYSELGFYNEAIDYFEKAIKRMNDHSEEIIFLGSEDTNKDYEAVFKMKRPVYRLFRSYASVLMFAGHFDAAYENLESIRKKMDLDIVNKITNEELMVEICGVYCDIGLCYNRKKDYPRSIELLEQAEIIHESFLTKLYLAQSYFQVEMNDRAKSLCERIVRDDPDFVGKFQALELLTHMHLDISDKDDKIDKITECIYQMEDLLKKRIGIFKSTYRDKYLYTKLIVIELQLESIIEKAYIHVIGKDYENYESLKLQRLENEFEDIIIYYEKETIDDPMIPRVYMSFCLCYSCFFNEKNIHLDKEGESLKTARVFFNKALEKVEKFPQLISHIGHLIPETAVSLSRAYNNYAMLRAEFLTVEERIKYLETALELQEKYRIRKLVTLNNLGLIYLNLGLECYQKFLSSQKNEFSKIALHNYNEALKYYKWKFKDQNDEKNFTSNCFSDDDTIVDKDDIYETEMCIIRCYNGKITLQYDLNIMRETVRYIDKMLNKDCIAKYKKELEEFKIVNQYLIEDLMKVLNCILNSSRDDNSLKSASEYSVKFCQHKFGIIIFLENKIMKWKSNGLFSMDDIKTKIREELNDGSNKCVISEFYKVLLEHGFLKNNY